MNVKQVDGEEGEDRSCGPVNVGLCSNLERPAFFPKESLAFRAWGAFSDTSLDLLIYKRLS